MLRRLISKFFPQGGIASSHELGRDEVAVRLSPGVVFPVAGEHGDLPERFRWTGEGAAPARWIAADGTIVYRSYADYCDD